MCKLLIEFKARGQNQVFNFKAEIKFLETEQYRSFSTYIDKREANELPCRKIQRSVSKVKCEKFHIAMQYQGIKLVNTQKKVFLNLTKFFNSKKFFVLI